MLIRCPHCGLRDEDEFLYGGAAGIDYPERSAELDDREWASYLFFRTNPSGDFRERWQHSSGCRRWFELVRDTRDNELRDPELSKR